MDATSGKDAAALVAHAAELAEHLGTLYSDAPGTTEVERTHALVDSVELLDVMLGIIYPLRQRLVGLSVERHHEAMARTDALLAASRAMRAEHARTAAEYLAGAHPTGGPTP